MTFPKRGTRYATSRYYYNNNVIIMKGFTEKMKW